jgi:hypothetical protein
MDIYATLILNLALSPLAIGGVLGLATWAIRAARPEFPGGHGFYPGAPPARSAAWLPLRASGRAL